MVGGSVRRLRQKWVGLKRVGGAGYNVLVLCSLQVLVIGKRGLKIKDKYQNLRKELGYNFGHSIVRADAASPLNTWDYINTTKET